MDMLQIGALLLLGRLVEASTGMQVLLSTQHSEKEGTETVALGALFDCP